MNETCPSGRANDMQLATTKGCTSRASVLGALIGVPSHFRRPPARVACFAYSPTAFRPSHTGPRQPLKKSFDSFVNCDNITVTATVPDLIAQMVEKDNQDSAYLKEQLQRAGPDVDKSFTPKRFEEAQIKMT